MAAADCYEKLVQVCPEEPSYKLYYAQSLYQACMYQEAWNVTSSIADHKHLGVKVNLLRAAIKYGQEDIVVAKNLIEQNETDDANTEVNLGCLLYKAMIDSFLHLNKNGKYKPSLLQEGKYEEALRNFKNALQISGFRPHLSYNVALCYYKLKEYAPSLKHIGT